MAKDIIVVGGGPSGIMAAISAAQAGANVTLWERNERLGRKLAITGKGRCNITNEAPLEVLVKNMPGNGRFLYSAFSRFPAEATMDFFRQIGVELKVERGRRVFPLSDDANQVVNALQKQLERMHVTIHWQRRAASLQLRQGRVLGLRDTKGGSQRAEAVIVTGGGLSYPATGSTGDGYHLARQAGHSIIPPQPSLVPLETIESWPGRLAGLSLKRVELTALAQGQQLDKQFGELLFTHFGLSGPIVLSLSRSVTAQPQQGQGVMLKLDLKPALKPEQLEQRLLRDFQTASRKQVHNALHDLLPQALLPVVLELAGLAPHKAVNQISRGERSSLVELLKGLPLTVKQARPLAEAIVTAGGVATTEVNPKTMASKLCSGLYFAGEVLDIDGLTGGYNLQAAWSSGYVAGQAAADSQNA